MYRPLIPVMLLATLTACNAVPAEVSQNKPAKQSLEGVLITSLPLPAGWQLKESKGFYCRFFEYDGRNNYAEKFNEALAGLREYAQQQGAQAFVNLQVSSSNYEIQGSKWSAARVHLCGDPVVLE